MHAALSATTLTGPQMLTFLLHLCLLLCLAVVLGRLAGRVGLPAVVGELTVGVVLGPSLLGNLPAAATGWLPQSDPGQFALVEAVAQLGVLLLVGLTGAELNIGALRRSGPTALRVSIAGLVVPLALGVGAGFLLPAMLYGPGTDQLTFALFMGVAMCVSAIPVLAKILMDMRLNRTPLGQLMLVAGVIDDAFGWLLLSLVSALVTAGFTAAALGSSLVGLAVIALVALVVGRPLVRLVLDRAGRSGEPIPVLGVAVMLMLLAAAGSQAVGQEPVLGAFLCGMLISASGKLPEESVAPLRTFVLAVLAPVFFALAGLRMDLRLLADPRIALTGIAVLLVAIAGKFTGAYLGARLSRLDRWEALALGAGLNARGVVQVIIATIGVRLGVLNAASYTIIVLVALVTSMLAPPLLRFAMARIDPPAARSEPATVDAALPPERSA